MKYIMFEKSVPGGVQRIPIIFPDQLVHVDVAEAIQNIIGKGRPVSAGSLAVHVFSVSGESTTLGLKHNPEDMGTICLWDYFHGLVDR